MSFPEPTLSTRGEAEYRFAELYLALGPQAIGAPGDATLQDLIGRVWALVLTKDRHLELYQRAEGSATWARVEGGLPGLFAQVQPDDRRRYSLAFDQSARVTIAYEEAGMVYLTRWDASAGAYVQNVTIAGVDPVVAFDATWAYDVTDSDVLLFYLSPDRTRLLARVQRQLYNTEVEIADLGEPRVLDRVIRLPLRYQALVSDAAGDPIEVGGTLQALVSELYPYPETDAVEVDGEVAGAIGHVDEIYIGLEEQTVQVDGEASGAIGHSDLISTYVEGPDGLEASGEASGLMSHDLMLFSVVDFHGLEVDGEVSGTLIHKEE